MPPPELLNYMHDVGIDSRDVGIEVRGSNSMLVLKSDVAIRLFAYHDTLNGPLTVHRTRYWYVDHFRVTYYFVGPSEPILDLKAVEMMIKAGELIMVGSPELPRQDLRWREAPMFKGDGEDSRMSPANYARG